MTASLKPNASFDSGTRSQVQADPAQIRLYHTFLSQQTALLLKDRFLFQNGPTLRAQTVCYSALQLLCRTHFGLSEDMEEGALAQLREVVLAHRVPENTADLLVHTAVSFSEELKSEFAPNGPVEVLCQKSAAAVLKELERSLSQPVPPADLASSLQNILAVFPASLVPISDPLDVAIPLFAADLPSAEKAAGSKDAMGSALGTLPSDGSFTAPAEIDPLSVPAVPFSPAEPPSRPQPTGQADPLAAPALSLGASLSSPPVSPQASPAPVSTAPVSGGPRPGAHSAGAPDPLALSAVPLAAKGAAVESAPAPAPSNVRPAPLSAPRQAAASGTKWDNLLIIFMGWTVIMILVGLFSLTNIVGRPQYHSELLIVLLGCALQFITVLMLICKNEYFLLPYVGQILLYFCGALMELQLDWGLHLAASALWTVYLFTSKGVKEYLGSSK